MKKFEIKGYHQSTIVDKFWFYVEAETKEEALEKAKTMEIDEWIDSKNIDVLDGEYIDHDQWEVVSEEEINESTN